MPSPTHLGKYEIRREIGKGSMGVVYEAFDPFIERRVAIKIIRQDQLGPSQTADLLARLRREAQAVGRLNHPGIVGIYDYGEDSTLGGSGVAFITMELIDGRELKDYFDNDHQFTQADIVRIMSEVLAALQHAHDHGVTHRDVKPSNVILLRNGGVKVADFGVARLDSSELTQAGTMIGTPMYMSPEQILGMPVDGRSDVFSCGVMLYQFLTGEKPFTGSITTVMQKVLHHEPVPVTQLNAALSPAWDGVLHKALAKKPADRYASAAAMAEGIRLAALAPPAYRQDEKTVVMPRRPDTGATAPLALPIRTPASTATPASAATAASTQAPMRSFAPAPPAAPAADTSAVAPRRTLPPAAVAAAAAALVGGAGLAYLLWPQTGRQPAAPLARTDAAASSAAPAAPSAAPPLATAPAPASASVSPPAPVPVVAPSPAAARPASTPAPAPKTVVVTAAPTPAPIPAPAATKPAIPVVTTRPAAAPPAPVPVPTPAPVPASDDWRPRVAKLEALRGPQTLGSALPTLLEPFTADERALVLEFETLFKQRPGPSALVVGVVDGHFRANWQTRGVTLQRAMEQARKRCVEQSATGCSVLLANGEFQREGLLTVARELGSQPPGVVRGRVLRAFERTVREWRQADGATLAKVMPSAPAYASAPPPPAPVVAPAPSPAPTTRSSVDTAAEPARTEWSQSLAQMRSENPTSIARGFELLLRTSQADDVERLSRFQSALKRLRWNSAVAMGEKNGYLVFAYAHAERRTDWAAERALADCSRAASAPCAVVMTDGSYSNAGLMTVAGRLGSRHQSLVRENFMRYVQRKLQDGLG